MTWLILVVLAAAALAALYSWDRREVRHRREALRRAAARAGLSFDPKARLFAAHPDLRELHVFRGRDGELLNVMRGTDAETELFLCDYRNGGPDEDGAAHETFVIVRSRTALPAFALQREGAGDKIAALLGSQDIDFTDRPEFSARYRLRGEHEPAVRALFADGLLRFWERLDMERGWEASGGDRWLALYRRDVEIDPGRWREHLDEALRIVAAFREVR
jgi:hypothetical protein